MEIYYILYFRQFVFLGNFIIKVLEHCWEHKPNSKLVS